MEGAASSCGITLPSRERFSTQCLIVRESHLASPAPVLLVHPLGCQGARGSHTHRGTKVALSSVEGVLLSLLRESAHQRTNHDTRCLCDGGIQDGKPSRYNGYG